MSAEVVKLRPADDPNVVLEAAKDTLNSVVVLGWTNDSPEQLYAAASMNMGPAEVNMLCDLLKAELLASAVSEA